MKSLPFLAAGAVAAFAFLATPAVAGEGWGTDYEAAAAEAKESGKLILADFTGSDWCGWCIKLKEEVFSKDAFKTWAADKVVLLELDFPRKKELPAELKAQNDKLQQKYEIQGFPTILFLDHDGTRLGKMGYEPGGPAAWTGSADKILTQAATYKALKAKESRSVDEEVELLLAEIKLEVVSYADAKARRDALTLNEDQTAKLAAVLTDLEVLDIMKTHPVRSEADAAKVGGLFAAIHAEGRKPTSDQAVQPFYPLIMEHAFASKKPELFEEAFGALKVWLKEKGLDNPRVQSFLTEQQGRLDQLKQGAAGGEGGEGK